MSKNSLSDADLSDERVANKRVLGELKKNIKLAEEEVIILAVIGA